MQIIEAGILNTLLFFFNITRNYGVSIVIITVLIKFVFYPLTFQSSKQMAAMQRLQPLIKNIQTKYKDDPKKSQEEMMAIYKRERVSPFGGCLPMLVQIPIFIGLFIALRSEKFQLLLSASDAGGKFLWITNLDKPDPTFILLALIVITTYYMQKTMPNYQQNPAMNYLMPALIGFISMPFPSGLQLYWVSSNIITAIQQMYIFRRLGIPVGK